MIPCPACGAFVRHSDSCPSCGRASRSLPRSAVAALLGLSVACSGEKTGDSGHTGTTDTQTTLTEPDYGVTVLHTGGLHTGGGGGGSGSGGGHTGVTTTPTDTAGGSGGTATHTGSTQVDYGVPTTTN